MIPFRSSTPLRSMRSPCRVKMFRAFPMIWRGGNALWLYRRQRGRLIKCRSRFLFLGGGGRGPPLWACRVACRAIRRPVPFQGAEVQANAASAPRAHLPLATGASFGREMWVISSMAFSLDGWSACETVFTAEQVGGDARQRRDRLPKTAGRCRAPLASCLGGLVGDGEGAAYEAGRGVILAVF